MTVGRPEAVDFHFDIMCPYAYQTSLWIREVRDLAGLEVRWRFFSLEEINRAEGKKHPWEREWSYGWSMMRIGAYLRRQDMDLLDRWYQAAGQALHVEGRKPHRPEVAEELLAEMGLDPGHRPGRHRRSDHRRRGAGRARDRGVQGRVRRAHPGLRRRAGPVRTGAGRSAGGTRTPCACGSTVTGWLEFPHLYELQRPKSPADIDAIVDCVRPLPRGAGLVHRADARHRDRSAGASLSRSMSACSGAR